MTHPPRRLALLGITTALTLVAIGPATHAAAPISPSQVGTPKKFTAGACGWTDPLPTLPAGCTAPTIANCTDEAWNKGACGSNKTLAPTSKHPKVPIIQQYCHKLLVDDFCKDPNREEVSAPDGGVPETAHSVLKPKTNKGRLFQAPGRIVGGRLMPYTPAPQKGGKKAPPATFSGTPTPQSGGAFTMNAKAGTGTFDTTSVGTWVPKYNSARQHGSKLHMLQVANAPAASMTAENEALFGLFTTDLWTGDGSASAANKAVNSCYEFAYQRWYDFSHFKSVAKALGPDYRAIYALAFSPTYNLEKAKLKQFGAGDLPLPWPKSGAVQNIFDMTKTLPRNPFWTTPTISPSVDTATQAAITARIAKHPPTSTGWYISLPTAQDTSRFALHKQMAALLERKYHPSDDALADRRARMKRYADLVDTRTKLMGEIECGLFANECCNGWPTHGGASTNKLIDAARGVAVINPDPTKIGNLGVNVGMPSSYASFQANDQLNLGTRAFAVKSVQNVAKMGLKQKAMAVGPQQVVSGLPVQTPKAGVTCQQKAVALGNAATIAIEPVKAQLSDLVVKEYAIPDGCLEDPGSDLGNSCDWSYEQFAHLVMTYFDDEVESSFHDCNRASKGDFKMIRDGNKQDKVIWPCELRHDFGTDQLDTQYFIDAIHDRSARYYCEVGRANDAVQKYLDDNRTTVDKIPINGDGIGESSGDSWSLGDLSSFGAQASYDMSWRVDGGKANRKTTKDGSWCHPEGDAQMSGNGKFEFFGTETEIFDAGLGETTWEASTTYHAHVRYYDMDQGSVRLIDPPVPVKTPLLAPIALPLEGPQLLGDLPWDVWFSIGPIPIHISFGANASSGLDLAIRGQHTDLASCNTPAQPIETTKLGYQSGVQFEPWAEADAWADASIDIIVASAGVRVDLTLLRLGLPVTVASSTDGPANLHLQSDFHLTTDALEGSVSAYVDIGIWPLELSYSQTIFSWDGLHSDTVLFGTDFTAPLKLATWAAQPTVSSASCLAHPNVAPADINFSGHPVCLKNPTNVPANSCPAYGPPPPTHYNGIAYPSACVPYYPKSLRGPTQ